MKKNSKFIIIPINSCNWSQSGLELQEKHNNFCNTLVNEFSTAINDAHAVTKFRGRINEELETLLEVDVAYISPDHYKDLQKIIENAENKAGQGAIKIALMHHHILPVNSDEEFKIYADFINLGKLRQFLKSHEFNILLHGHKHTNSVYVDHIYQDDSVNFDAHEVLVISGGTMNSDGKDIFRIIELESLPYAPLCKISNVSMVQSGHKFTKEHIKEVTRKSLWKSKNSKEPIIVSGKNINEVYERACQLLTDNQLLTDKKILDKTLICYVEFTADSETEMSPPVRYPRHPDEDKSETQQTADLTEWFKETVKWWQLDHSKSEKRIPYIHGTRLYRFGGAKNQIDRIVKLLEGDKSTSKAIAVLIDPIRDFHDNPVKGNPERFASFCFVQFKIHNNHLECVAYYRAQEFCKWWPVNVAELRILQHKVWEKLTDGKNAGLVKGGITTITADARIEVEMSPTQVAVPIIDQWVDCYSHKIAAIAYAVLWPKSGSDKSDYQAEWRRWFNDILIPTSSYTDEGIPIAIEGLIELENFLREFADKNNVLHESLIRHVKNLRIDNEGFHVLSKNLKKERFKVWSEKVIDHVTDIIKDADNIFKQANADATRS